MPIYEYRCISCGHMFDVRQGFNDPVEAACPQCRSASQRVIQPVGIVFKGSGWHITDYRKASSAALNPSGGKPEEGGGSSEASKSAEPAAAAGAKPAPAPASSSTSSASPSAD
ncbi:MAG: FmdB family zinc ribbon protein [Chloroflexota bacterium]